MSAIQNQRLLFFLWIHPITMHTTHQKNGVIKKNNTLESVKNM